MKIIIRAMVLSSLVAILMSCTALPAGTAETPIPAATISPTSAFTLAPAATASPQPAEPSSQPTSTSSIPVSTAPTTVVMENGLTWTECVLPNRDYYHGGGDIGLITDCLDMEFPLWDDNDRRIAGERLPGVNGSDVRQVVGSDVYETRFDSSGGCCDYELLRNGDVIATVSAPLISFDPNQHMWNIGGHAVWEVITQPPDIFVDGVSVNESSQLEGAYFPYEVNGKLMFIAASNGRFRVVYDGEPMGPEYDAISMAYCCALISVSRGQGQYGFLGQSEGTLFAVAIH
jgi:hypothetical protein